MVTGLAARTLDASLDACVVVDAQANICFVNERASEALGRLPRAIIGRNLWEFIPEGRESPFGQAVRAALTETTPVVVTDEFPVRQRLTESRIVPIADARIVAVFFKDVTAERQTQSNLSASHQELRDLGRRVREAQETERRRIARELHDVMGQSLSVIKMRLQLLRKRMVKSGSSPENIALCEAVVGDTDDALQSARRLAVELRPSVLDELGLHAALQWQAQDMMAKTGLDIRVRFEAADRAASEGRRSTTGRETVVFRAVQELHHHRHLRVGGDELAKPHHVRMIQPVELEARPRQRLAARQQHLAGGGGLHLRSLRASVWGVWWVWWWWWGQPRRGCACGLLRRRCAFFWRRVRQRQCWQQCWQCGW
jgi:PAS domain S-box-containing protein